MIAKRVNATSVIPTFAARSASCRRRRENCRRPPTTSADIAPTPFEPATRPFTNCSWPSSTTRNSHDVSCGRIQPHDTSLTSHSHSFLPNACHAERRRFPRVAVGARRARLILNLSKDLVVGFVCLRSLGRSWEMRDPKPAVGSLKWWRRSVGALKSDFRGRFEWI